MTVSPGNLFGTLAIMGMLSGGAALAADRDGWIEDLREAPVTSDITYEGRSVSDLKSMTVVNKEGQQVGAVKHLLVDPRKEPKALAVDVDNSLTGSREVVLRLGEATLDPDRNEIVVSLDADAIKALPLWKTVP